MHTHVHTHIYSPCCRMKQPLGACWYILFVCEDSSISALCACLICVPCMRALHACLICALCARLLPPQNRNCNRRNRRSAANSSAHALVVYAPGGLRSAASPGGPLRRHAPGLQRGGDVGWGAGPAPRCAVAVSRGPTRPAAGDARARGAARRRWSGGRNGRGHHDARRAGHGWTTAASYLLLACYVAAQSVCYVAAQSSSTRR